MHHTTSAPPPTPAADTLSDDDLRHCVRVLRAIQADRSQLVRLTQEQRRELLTLAGLVAKPEGHELVKMRRAFRRAEREATKAHDRKVIEQAGLRIQRRSAVYAPLWLERPKPEAPTDDRPEFSRERACYVCKQPFAKMHRYYDSMCEACGDFNYAKREQTADLSRPLCPGHRRPGQDWLSGIPETPAGRCACHRHHPLPGRCGRPLLEGAGFPGLPRASANPRHRSPAHPECGAVRPLPARTAATARLYLSTTPARPCAGRRASFNTCWPGKPNRSARFPRPGEALSPVTTNCGAPSKGLRQGRHGAPAHWLLRPRNGRAKDCCTARRSPAALPG